MKVSGTKLSSQELCRSSAQPSSKKLRSFSALQIAFQSSYWVTASTPRLANKAGIVTVDDLAEQVSIRIIGPDVGQDIRPEPSGDGIGRVQPPTVGTAPQPVVHDAGDIIGNLRLVMIQGHELAMAFEGRVVRFSTRSRRHRPR